MRRGAGDPRLIGSPGVLSTRLGSVPCASSPQPPAEAEKMDCYLSASLHQESPLHGWQRELHGELVRPSTSTTSSVAVAAWRQRTSLTDLFDAKQQALGWHLTTQERLFRDLRSIWPNDRPRNMVDLGCHAGADRTHNMSDALIWLDYFNHSGTVLAVDIFEDFALDLAHRMNDLQPYASMSGVDRRGVALAIGTVDDLVQDFYSVVEQHIHCCAGLQTVKPVLGWCAGKFARFERLGFTDHMCRITRQRLGLSPSSLPLPASSFDAELFNSTVRGRHQRSALPYNLRTMRTDTLWRRELGAKRIDFLKIDVDMPWTWIGLEGLIAQRGFRVMSIEIDGTWTARGKHKAWAISVSDQLAWASRFHGYASFIKVPCHAQRNRDPSNLRDGKRLREPGKAAWYFPLASPSTPFSPSGATQVTMHDVQDMLVVDAREEGLVQKLAANALQACQGLELSSPQR